MRESTDFRNNFKRDWIMKTLNYVLLAALLLVIFTYAARAEKIEVVSLCPPFTGDWSCINATQTVSDEVKLAHYQVLKVKIKRLKLKKPRKVIITDLYSTRGRLNRPTFKNGVLTFPTGGCPSDIKAVIEVLKNG